MFINYIIFIYNEDLTSDIDKNHLKSKQDIK